MYPGTHAATTPDKPAVIMAGSGATLTYAALDDRSSRLANLLREAGLGHGDHVALLADNSLFCYEVYWAALRSGLYVTPVNWRLSQADIAYVVDNCGAAAVVVSAALGPVAEAVVTDTPKVRVRLAFSGPVAGHDDYEAGLAKASAKPLDDRRAGIDMLYSSGTTGRPKGVQPPLPDHDVDKPGAYLVPLLESFYGMGPDTVYLSPAPAYHAAPLRFGGSVHALGGTVVMMERFDAEAALRLIEKYRVTHSQWVPTMFVRMLKLPDEVRSRYDLSSHRVAVHAAAPCPVEVKRAMIDWWGPILYEYYSSTEASGITFVNPHEWLAHPGTVGRPGLGIVHICDDDGNELPTGQTGLIYFERDKDVFSYHRDPETTAATRHPTRQFWTTTGDVGYLDADGFLYLTDRKAFMIISGGVNIYPQEVENVLALHPKVVDVAVIGIPDEEMGEQVKAVVQPAAGVETGPELEREIIDFVRLRLARFKAPRSVDFVDDFPRTETGKLVKGKLRGAYLGKSD